MDQRSQAAEILKHLQAGKSITPLEALEKFGCFRLGGRIHELRTAGHKIVTDMVTDKKTKKYWACYRLEKP